MFHKSNKVHPDQPSPRTPPPPWNNATDTDLKKFQKKFPLKYEQFIKFADEIERYLLLDFEFHDSDEVKLKKFQEIGT